MKNKFVVLFSVFVVFLIVLLPTLSANQISTIEKIIHSEPIEQKDIIDIMDIGDKLKVECFPKHPILYSIANTIYVFRMFRASIYFHFSIIHYDDGWQPNYEIIHPLLFLRGRMLFETGVIWGEFWYKISDYFGWDWFY